MVPKERRGLRTKTVRDVICFTEDGEGINQNRYYFFARMIDFSDGGVGLETEQHCETDDEICLQGLDNISEIITGKVRWKKRSGSKFNIGLQFKTLP